MSYLLVYNLIYTFLNYIHGGSRLYETRMAKTRKRNI